MTLEGSATDTAKISISLSSVPGIILQKAILFPSGDQPPQLSPASLLVRFTQFESPLLVTYISPLPSLLVMNNISAASGDQSLFSFIQDWIKSTATKNTLQIGFYIQISLHIFFRLKLNQGTHIFSLTVCEERLALEYLGALILSPAKKCRSKAVYLYLLFISILRIGIASISWNI
jgi:hypothetical protein